MIEILTATEPATIVLAPVIGAYLLLSAVGFLRAPEAVRAFAAELAGRPALAHALGAIAFLTGAGVVSVHRHWSTPPEIAVSLTGLWWAFEGAGLLAAPAAAAAALRSPEHQAAARALNLVALLVGAYLLTATAVTALT